MEYWDILTSDGKKTGKRMKRDTYNHFSPGEYHLVVHIWVINSAGEFLIQKRSEDREPMPGEWAATGGSVLSGEASLAAATRELKEELGITVLGTEMHFLKRFVRKNSLVDIWWAQVDADLQHLALQEEEVTEVRWVRPEELRSMIARGTFHHYGADYFEAVFSLIDKK